MSQINQVYQSSNCNWVSVWWHQASASNQLYNRQLDYLTGSWAVWFHAPHRTVPTVAATAVVLATALKTHLYGQSWAQLQASWHDARCCRQHKMDKSPPTPSP
jgi:hypothetical protein